MADRVQHTRPEAPALPLEPAAPVEPAPAPAAMPSAAVPSAAHRAGAFCGQTLRPLAPVLKPLVRVVRYLAPVLLFVPLSLLPLGLLGGESSPAPQVVATAAVPAPIPPAPMPTDPGVTVAMPVTLLRSAPAIPRGATPPHGYRGRCAFCHDYLPSNTPSPAASGTLQAAATPQWPRPSVAQPFAAAPQQMAPQQVAPPRTTAPGTPAAGTWTAAPAGAAPAAPAPRLTMLPFQEAHWQGLELIAFTPSMARLLEIPRDARGVVVDEATMPADLLGFGAGDLVTAVGDTPTPTLEQFVEAADRVRDAKQVTVRVLRKGRRISLVLTSATARLGTANGETAPMIPSGSRPPHGYMGPCTNCHHIGTGQNLAVDLGDPLTKTAPPIRAGQPRPHRDRGKCSACHVIR